MSSMKSIKKLGLEQPTNTPSELLKVFKILGTDPYTMKKENGAYVITFDSSKLKDQSKLADAFLSDMKGLLKDGNLDPNEKKDIQQTLSNGKFNEMKQVITIDEKTFRIKNIDILQDVTLKVKDQDLSYKRDLIMEFIGIPSTPITIPEDIKKNTKELKL